MRKKEICLKQLLSTIENRNLMDEWGNGLFTTTDEEKLERANKIKEEAISSFKKMMSSPKNDGKEPYQIWAINKALGLRS